MIFDTAMQLIIDKQNADNGRMSSSGLTQQ